LKHPWDTSVYGSKILESVMRAEMTQQSVPNKESASWMACHILRILYIDIQEWKNMFSGGKYNLPRMTPKEREETLDELSQNARHLLENIEALNLPLNLLPYFPEASSSLLVGPHYLTRSNYERELQFVLRMREYGTRVDTWLKILSDKERVKMIAPTSPLRKAEVKNPQLSYIVRMIARFFYTHYRKKLPTTIERICHIEFPDADVSNNTINTILRNFDPKDD